MVKSLNRLAFTMIELIFAIVIIGIAVTGLPFMTNITNRVIDSNLAQEAIFAGSAEIMGASSGYWDANSMQDNALSHISRVIDIGGLCDNNVSATSYRLRPGHIEQPLHRRCLENNAIGVSNAADNTWPSVDNAAHGLQNMMSTGAIPDEFGYKYNYNSRLDIAQVGDIKTIVVNVFEAGTGVPLTGLTMYTANIGEIDYFKREF